jgi:hypothetical protein
VTLEAGDNDGIVDSGSALGSEASGRLILIGSRSLGKEAGAEVSVSVMLIALTAKPSPWSRITSLLVPSRLGEVT